MIADLERKVAEIAADVDAHTCRNDDHCPYTKPCRRCGDQLHALSALNAARTAKK